MTQRWIRFHSSKPIPLPPLTLFSLLLLTRLSPFSLVLALSDIPSILPSTFCSLHMYFSWVVPFFLFMLQTPKSSFTRVLHCASAGNDIDPRFRSQSPTLGQSQRGLVTGLKLMDLRLIWDTATRKTKIKVNCIFLLGSKTENQDQCSPL